MNLFGYLLVTREDREPVMQGDRFTLRAVIPLGDIALIQERRDQRCEIHLHSGQVIVPADPFDKVFATYSNLVELNMGALTQKTEERG